LTARKTNFAQRDFPDEVANWFHVVEDEYCKQVKDDNRKYKDADREQDAIADKLVDLEKQLWDRLQALVVKQPECDKWRSKPPT
jgi:hypothetical protein